ncbi:MAG: hypothetical protein MUC88_15175 [Planctomycetes bacterium]|nr:hypothetical protein [Planctomycetota bacterium]
MRKWVVVFAFVAVAETLSWAGPHSFPSSSSTVVGSVGIIDGEKIGYFWSVARGDSVESVLADSLPEVSHAIFDFAVPENLLDLGVVVIWDVSVNSQVVGDFEVHDTFQGPLHLDLTFDPIANVAGLYTVRFAVTNEVTGGEGSHALAYGGLWPHSVELIYDYVPPDSPIPAPAALCLSGLGAALIGYLRCRRVL